MMLINSMVEALMMLCIVVIVAGLPIGFVMFMISQFGMIGLFAATFLLLFGLLTFVIYAGKASTR